MQSFALNPVNAPGQRNFVFVDEHNRHKRLKVVRACEGCRRRKIKCDAASTNTWPCGPCKRLKLQCVPPSAGLEQDPVNTVSFPSTEESVDYGASSFSQPPTMQTQLQDPIHSYGINMAQSHHRLTSGYSQPFECVELSTSQYPLESYPMQFQAFSQQQLGAAGERDVELHLQYPVPQRSQLRNGSAASTSESDHTTAENLSEALGDLKIGETGVAPYLREQRKADGEPDGPVHEAEVKLPPLSSAAGSQIRIPPALMPSDGDALDYFEVFFKDVHPYVPVVNKAQFYQQWRSNRTSLSPLLLEAIFACAGRLSEDPAQGAQWLALGNKHEQHFLDTPRLSTLQALLLLLKARESAPKRGYYYRSWMTCRTIVFMAKDLEINEHYESHADGKTCGSDPVECLTKTRIWQTILVCEMMVGAPQGRTDFGVDPDTVDIRPNPPYSDMNEFEASLSRRFAYFVRNARNIRLIGDTARKARKKNDKDWGLDPELVAHNAAFDQWPNDLPADLQLSLPTDGSPPWLPTHFIGNMHSHYQLGVLMLHRPQLVASKAFDNKLEWKRHMRLCYDSSKTLCRLQEAILKYFGPPGLLCMQRGINFTIYAILTCTMIHLVAITLPDPAFNTDAREYFTRHMRILEQCMSHWPMPEMESQVNTLRLAFSADTDKPFELKPSFPYGSPSDSYQPSTPLESSYQHLQTSPNPSYIHGLQTMTPPISAGASDSRMDSPQIIPGPVMPHLPTHLASSSASSSSYHQPPPLIPEEWNPRPIFDRFDTAFAIPPSAFAPPSSDSHSPPAQIPLPRQVNHPTMPPDHQPHYISNYTQTAMLPTNTITQQSYHPYPQQSSQLPQYQPNLAQTPVTNLSDPTNYISPTDWQRSVASVFDPTGSLKRTWDYSATEMGQMQKRMR